MERTKRTYIITILHHEWSPVTGSFYYPKEIDFTVESDPLQVSLKVIDQTTEAFKVLNATIQSASLKLTHQIKQDNETN